MELVTPALGLIFWMTLSFLIVLFLLKKFAWKPIMQMLKEREQTIEDSLRMAEQAKEQIALMQLSNENLLKEAKDERDMMMRDARTIKDKIIAEAKEKADVEGKRIIEEARQSINNEKMLAISELKNQLAFLSIEIAEKVLKEKLADDEKQKELINNLLKEIKFN